MKRVGDTNFFRVSKLNSCVSPILERTSVKYFQTHVKVLSLRDCGHILEFHAHGSPKHGNKYQNHQQQNDCRYCQEIKFCWLGKFSKLQNVSIKEHFARIWRHCAGEQPAGELLNVNWESQGYLAGVTSNLTFELKSDVSTIDICFFLPVNAGHTWDILWIANSFSEQSVSDLPGKHGGVLLLVFTDRVHNMRCGNLGFTATDDTSLEVASLVISWQNLGDTSMADSQLSADVTRSHSLMGHFNNLLSHNVGKGTTVDKVTSELINSSVTWNEMSNEYLTFRFKVITELSDSYMYSIPSYSGCIWWHDRCWQHWTMRGEVCPRCWCPWCDHVWPWPCIRGWTSAAWPYTPRGWTSVPTCSTPLRITH